MKNENMKTQSDHHSRHARAALGQVEHLARIQQPVELVQQLGALVAAALRVDEHQDRFDVRRRYRLDDEDLVGPTRVVVVMVADDVVRRAARRAAGARCALAARRTAAAARTAAAVALPERRLLATADRRLERTLNAPRTYASLILHIVLIL